MFFGCIVFFDNSVGSDALVAAFFDALADACPASFLLLHWTSSSSCCCCCNSVTVLLMVSILKFGAVFQLGCVMFSASIRNFFKCNTPPHGAESAGRRVSRGGAGVKSPSMPEGENMTCPTTWNTAEAVLFTQCTVLAIVLSAIANFCVRLGWFVT